MSTRKILLVLLIIAFNQGIFAQTENEVQIDKIFQEYNERAVASLFFIESTKNLLIESINLETVNTTWVDFENKIYGLEKNKLDELKFNLKDYLNKREKTESKSIIDSINRWCNIDFNLDNANMFYDAESVELAEVLNDIDEAKHLVKKYIGENEPYLKSLTRTQTIDLYYQLMEYVFSLESKKQFYFIIKYTTSIEKLNK